MFSKNSKLTINTIRAKMKTMQSTIAPSGRGTQEVAWVGFWAMLGSFFFLLGCLLIPSGNAEILPLLVLAGLTVVAIVNRRDD